MDGPSIAAGELSPGGTRLQQFLDGLPVEQNWLAGHRIVWETGQQNGPDNVGPEDHTHCSAFAAAVALYLDRYLLRPPHHSQELLSDAQVAWLGGAPASGPSASESGWQDLGSSGDAGALAAAVAAANAGRLVVAGYQEPAGIPGHVALVRPQTAAWSPDQGPELIMAGDRNWRRIHMRAAFSDHAGAWPSGIRLFACDTDLPTEFTAEDGIG